MIINVTIEDFDDGSVRVTSKDLPGLVLGGRDKTKIIAAIYPAACVLLQRKGIDATNLRIDADLVGPNKVGHARLPQESAND